VLSLASMVDNNDRTRLQHMQTQLTSISKWMEEQRTRDQNLQDRLEKLQSDSQTRLDLMQSAIDLLLQKTTSAIDGTNANSGSIGSSNGISVTPCYTAPPVRDISLGFPHFDGSTPVLEWIFKAEKFFSYHNTLDVARVDIAAMHFDKDVVPWFQMSQKLSLVSTWFELTRALESQFGPSPFDCPMAELFKLDQTGSVSDYCLKFMSLANRCFGLSDEAFLNCFLSGLDPDIRRDVIAMSPPNLSRAVALAKLYGDKYVPASKATRTSYTHKYSTISSTPATPNVQQKTQNKSSLPPLLPTPPGPPLKNYNVKKISPAEMQLRREKGLCYFCDEKFSFNHRCPNRQMLFLQLEDDETEDPISLDIPHGSPEVEVVHSEDHHLSLNALKGGVGIGAIRFMAYIDKLPVTVLIDGGSSDNFLQPRVAKFLKLPVESATQFRVMVGNGNYMTAEGMVKKLNVQAQGNLFQLPIFLLPISGADLILGASWLKTIGPHIADYDALQLKFLSNGRFTTLQGDPTLVPDQAQLHHIRRMVVTNSIAEIYNLQLLEENVTPKSLLELPMIWNLN